MGARPIGVITGILALTIVVAFPSVRAQTTPTLALETPAPPAAGSPAPAPKGEIPTVAAPATTPPPATSPTPGAQTPAATAPPTASPSAIAPILRAEQLDQLLAPIALYPDALLAQILMAATYPLEIVKARRWVQDPRHAALSGDQLAAALDAETWDPSALTLASQVSVSSAAASWSPDKAAWRGSCAQRRALTISSG